MFILITIVCLLSIQTLFAQEQEQYPYDGPQFVKRIENNVLNLPIRAFRPDGSIIIHYNLNSKTEVEKLFFGEFNAPVEYFFEPDFGTAFGFRIVKDSVSDSPMLEIKIISNYDEVRVELEEKFPSIGFKNPSLVPDSVIKQSAIHNRSMYAKRKEESLKLYRIKTFSFPVSSQFAEILRDNMATLIEHFEGLPGGQYETCAVTFRYVVGNEVRTLLIQGKPQGKIFQLCELCQQIIADGIGGKLNEPRYMELLGQMN